MFLGEWDTYDSQEVYWFCMMTQGGRLNNMGEIGDFGHSSVDYTGYTDIDDNRLMKWKYGIKSDRSRITG